MMERPTIVNLLRTCCRCSMLRGGVQLHGALIKLGLGPEVTIANDLVAMYGKCGQMDAAAKVFEEMPVRNVVSWTVLMSARLQQGNPGGALEVSGRMHRSGAEQNEFTLSTSLKASGLAGVTENGSQVHGLCIKIGYDLNLVVCNSLIHMYSVFGRIDESRRVFDEMATRNLISWNSMVAAYVTAGRGNNALVLFKELQKQGEVPDEFSYASALKACSSLKAIYQGEQIHSFLVTAGFLALDNEIISGALIDLYVKCNDLLTAQKMFDETPRRNIIMWTTLLTGYTQQGHHRETMDLFRRAWNSPIKIDGFIVSTIVGVCADFALIEHGRQVHCYTIKVPLGSDVSVANSIVDMYINCGMGVEAEHRFKEIPTKNVVSWTVMINGYGKHGNGYIATSLFNEMQQLGMTPDEVTYLSVLSACSHNGLVKECWHYFSMLKRESKVRPRVEHYACMVDLLGRTGQLKEAKSFIEQMPLEPNIEIWQTLLGACRVHRNARMGMEVGAILMEMDKDNPANYVALSNIYADRGYWEECEGVRKTMKQRGLQKQGGWSCVVVVKQPHFFYGNDDTHPFLDEIIGMLLIIERQMKEELWYLAQESCLGGELEEYKGIYKRIYHPCEKYPNSQSEEINLIWACS